MVQRKALYAAVEESPQAPSFTEDGFNTDVEEDATLPEEVTAVPDVVPAQHYDAIRRDNWRLKVRRDQVGLSRFSQL